MREIKFRSWYKENKEMSQWEDIKEDELMSDFENENYVYMQFTGLKDKNGKEIYEGDILEIQAWHVDKHNGYEKIDMFYRSAVEWGMAGWWLLGNDTLYNNSEELFEGDGILDILEAAWDNGNFSEDEKGISNFLIVGNIYENPELINND